MNLDLNQLTTIRDFLISANYWGLPLLFSIAVPTFYIGFKKLAEKNDENNTGIKAYILNFFSMPRVESWIIVFSTISFVIGCFTIVYGANRQECIRLNGLKVKSYMRSQNAYMLSIDKILQETGTNEEELYTIAETFPDNFLITKRKFYTDSAHTKSVLKTTFFITDTLLHKQIAIRATKLLDAYLTNNYVCAEGNMVGYNDLYSENNYFTREVVDQLIIDSSHKYTMNYLDIYDPKKGFAIVRKSSVANSEKLLKAYLDNSAVMKPNDIISYNDLFTKNYAFTKEVIEKLVADYNKEYTINLMDTAHLELGFGIVKK